MKISEIVKEDIPGMTPTLNTGSQSTFKPQGTTANVAVQNPTSNYTSLNNPGNNTNTQNSQQAKQAQQNNISQAGQNNPATNNQPINPAVAQKLSKGGKLQLPIGPNKKLTQFNITNVASNGDVTLQDPNNASGPGQTYKKDQLANLMSGNA